jgi:hypothetical protein
MNIKPNNKHQVPFDIPKEYFEGLPDKILEKVNTEKKLKKTKYATLSLISTVAASIFLFWIFLLHPQEAKKSSAEIQLSETEVMQYLLYSGEISETELLELAAKSPEILTESDDILNEITDEYIEDELLDADIELFY